MQPGLSQIGGLTVFAFDASQLGVFAQPLGGAFTPTAPEEVLGMSGAIAALDGPEFDNCAGQDLPPGNAAAYAASQCGYPRFLVLDQGRGVSFEGTSPGDGLTVSIIGGQASVQRGSSVAPGASVAVQLFPALVLNGQVVVSNNGSNAISERRAALAVISPTQLAFVIGASDMVTFASAIRRMGAVHAGYTDGGGSTSLVLPQEIHGASERRRTPTWLVANAGGVSPAGAAVGALLLAVAVGAGIYYFASRKTTQHNPSLDEIRGVRRIVDTASLRNGDDIAGIGYADGRGSITTFHVTTDPSKVRSILRRHGRLMAAYGEAGRRAELGPGLYTSGVPEVWMNRAHGKWSFLNTLTPAQTQALTAKLRSELEHYRSRDRITDGEYERGMRDIGYVTDGHYDASALVYFAGQPYNVAFWKADFLKPLGIAPGKEPSVVELRVSGPLAEVDRSWPDANTLRMLRRAGVVGAFTRAGMGTNPELVIWDSHAIRFA